MKFLISLLYIILVIITAGEALAADNQATKPASGANTLRIEADKIEYDQDSQVVIVSGHAKITYGNRVFESEEARFDSKTNILSTNKEYTIYENGKAVISGKSIAYNITEASISHLDDYVAIVNEGKAAFVKAKKIENTSEGQVFTNADATLCTRVEKDYHISASKITYNMDTKKLYMENAFIYMGNVPIFYLPSLSMKIKEKKKRKKPRELFPQITTTQQRGTAIKAELGDIFDMMGYESPEGEVTFSPYVVNYSKIGWGGGANLYYEMNSKEYIEAMVDYKNDVKVTGGIIYTRNISSSDGYTVYLDKRDILNGTSLDNYFTYYSITELPYILYSNSYSIGSFIGMPARLGYSLGYGSFSETLIGVASASPSINDERYSANIGANFDHTIYESDVQRVSYGLSLSENYASYGRSTKTQSVANMTNTLNYSLYFLSTSVSLVSLNQQGFSPFSFDKRGIGDRYLVTSGRIALGSDFYIPLGYNRNLDNNTDILILYGLYYETDCLKFGFRANTISQEVAIDLLVKGL